MEFFTRLVVAALMTTVFIVQSTNSVAPNCVDDNPVCFNCRFKGTCATGSAPTMGDACPDGEACVMLGNVPSCKPIAETKCNCDGKSKGCDAYDPLLPMFCVGGKLYPETTLCTDSIEVCSGGQCVAPSEAPVDPSTICKGKPIGFQLSNPDCSSGIFCADDAVVDTIACQASEYFDLTTSSCKSIPLDPCADCTESKCLILTDCNKYAVCVDGKKEDEETCPSSEFFDDTPTVLGCGNPAAGTCESYKDCKFKSSATSAPPSDTTTANDTASAASTTPAPSSNTTVSSTTDSSKPNATTPASTTPASTSTTTSKPSTCTAANVNKRYPHESDCKKYYTCRLISRSTYGYVESKCVGTLVFNPTNSYCDLPENVPSCQ